MNSSTSSSFKLSPRLKLLIDVTIQSADDEEKFLYGDSSPPSNLPSTSIKSTAAEKNISNVTDFQWSDDEYEDSRNQVELKSHNDNKSFGNSEEIQILNINSNSLNANKSFVPTPSCEKRISSSKKDSEIVNVKAKQTTKLAVGESIYKFLKANTSIQPVSSTKLSVSLKPKENTLQRSSDTLVPSSNALEVSSYSHNLKTKDCKTDYYQKELTENKSNNKRIIRKSIDDLSVIELTDDCIECDCAPNFHSLQSLKLLPFKTKNARKFNINNVFEADEESSYNNETNLTTDHFVTRESRKNRSEVSLVPRTSYKQREENPRYRSFSHSPRRYSRNISPSSPSRNRSYRSHCSYRSLSRDRSPRYNSQDRSSRYHSRCHSPRYHSQDRSSRYHSRCRSPRYHSRYSIERCSHDRSPIYGSKSSLKYHSTERSPEKGSRKKSYQERSPRCRNRESKEDLFRRRKNRRESEDRSRSPQSYKESLTSKHKRQSLGQSSYSPSSIQIERHTINNLNSDGDSYKHTSEKVTKRELNKKKKRKKVQKGYVLKRVTITKIPSVKSNHAVTKQSKPNVLSEKDVGSAEFCKNIEQQDVLNNCIEEIDRQKQSQQNLPSDSNSPTSVASSQTQPLPLLPPPPPIFNVQSSPFVSPHPRIIHPPQIPPPHPFASNFNASLHLHDEIHPEFRPYPPEELNPYVHHERYPHVEFSPDFRPHERCSRFHSPRIPAPYCHPNLPSRSHDAFLPQEPFQTIHPPPVKRIYRDRFSNNKKNLTYLSTKNASISTQASKTMPITPPVLNNIKQNPIGSDQLTAFKNYKECLAEQRILQKILKNTNVDYSALRNLLTNLEAQNKCESNPNIIQCKDLFSKSQKTIKATIELLRANHNKIKEITSKLNQEEIAETQRVFDEELAAGKYKPSIPEVECVNSDDSVDIWCDLCCTECSSVEQLFSHLCSPEHFKQVQSSNQVSLKEPKKLKYSNCVKGVEFLNSVVLFHCKLCSKSLNGETVARLHLDSEEHISNYMEFLKENPIYEQKRELLKNVKIFKMTSEKLEKDKEEKVIKFAKRQKSIDKSMKSEHLTDIENEDIKEIIEDTEKTIKDNDIKEVIEDEDIKEVTVVNIHTHSKLTKSVAKTESKD